jgi:hypothetical protein
MRLATIGILAALIVALGAPALAQVEIETVRPPAEPEPRVVPPPLHYETTRPPETDLYPRGTKVEHDPAFIEPFAVRWSTPDSSGRFGLSGWTAPNIPVGGAASTYHEVSGWFALGFSFTWDGPPPARAPRARQ